MSVLVRQFEDFGAWRTTVGRALSGYTHWLDDHGLSDGSVGPMLVRARERLSHEKLSVAFVAEFSRGKSELINAIFFAGYGQRILPSSAGRTTMCPTELRYEPDTAPSLMLLPIDTRAQDASVSELRTQPELWTTLTLDIGSPERMAHDFARVAETRRVPKDIARAYGLFDEDDPDQAPRLDANGTVEISCWRHAIINFPHPLLQQGLVIIDTPGLNAIGSEPELTLNLIPNADAVLFILAADTGVTKSDLEIWRRYIGNGAQHARIVALNKIDAMWDELRSADDVQAQIERQVADCAQLLGLGEERMFPVSAQKGLVAKIHRDEVLLERSRLPALEHALADQLVPQRQQIIAEQLALEVEHAGRQAHAVLASRARALSDELHELEGVRGKNTVTVERTRERIAEEKREFDALMRHLLATRSVFGRLSNDVYAALGMDTLRERVRAARDDMLASRFTLSLRDAMREFIRAIQSDFAAAEAHTLEIHQLMAAMYKRFSTEQGMTLPPVQPLRLKPYMAEFDRVVRSFEQEFGALRMLTSDQTALIRKFFETVASRIKDIYTRANRDIEAWLKSIMAPIEIQARDQQRALRKRLDSVNRAEDASGALASRIDEVHTAFDEAQALVSQHAAELALVRSQIFALARNATVTPDVVRAAR